MSLIPWSRRSSSQSLRPRSDFDDMVQSLFESFPSWPRSMVTEFSPSVDVKENEKHVTVVAELPGIDKKDIEVQVSGDELTLRGEKRDERVEQKENWWRKETFSGMFMRRIALPCEVDAENAEAKMDRGILTIRFAKAGDKKAKTVKLA